MMHEQIGCVRIRHKVYAEGIIGAYSCGVTETIIAQKT